MPGTCDPTTGMCTGGMPMPCDDGDACNGTETCDPAFGCSSGTPVVCSGDACTMPGTCDPTTGLCSGSMPIPCDDSDPCSGVETCDPATGCQPGTPVVCNAAGCAGAELCDPTTGACVPMMPGFDACDDGDACTTDTCVTNVCGGGPGCMTMPPTGSFPGYDITSCDLTVGPGSSCADIDALEGCLQAACIAGCGGTCSRVATGGSWNCDNGGATETRSEGYYECSCGTGSPPPPGCAGAPGPGCGPPGVACGDIDCDGADDCDGSATTECDNDCTSCTHVAVNCDDGLYCNGAETCDPGDGSCMAGMAPMCDDMDVCNGLETCNETTDMCDPGTPLGCDDGLYCNGLETCDSTSGCMSGMAPMCDDMDVCNGLESCNEMTDACDAGIALNCDDSVDCTDDMCDPSSGCSNTPNGNCMCTGTAPTYTESLSYTVFDMGIGCPPPLGGQMKGTVSISGSISAQEAHCSNSCTNTTAGSITANGEIAFCSGVGLKQSAGVTASVKQKACEYCDTADCKKKCDDQSCTTVEGGGVVSIGVSKFFGQDVSGGVGPVSLQFKCGATVGGSATLTGTAKDVAGELSCGDCVDCFSVNANLAVAATADAGCALTAKFGSFSATVGVPKIGTANITGYGGNTGNISGDCPFGSCPYIGVKGALSVNTPCVGFSFLFLSIGVECYLNTSACAEANSCGTCSSNCSACADARLNWNCNTCSP